jgi:uncharacterized protein (DUF1501 family)
MSNELSRRDILKWATVGAGAAAVGATTWIVGRDDGSPSAAPSSPNGSADRSSSPNSTAAAAPPAAATAANGDIAKRLLIVVELDGGNDGMSTLVPYGISGYNDLRKRTAIAETDVLTLNDQVGLHAKLKNVHRRGAAIVQGVGSSKPDGSHFEMMARWWSGDPLSTRTFDTGFLGRLADTIGDPAAAATAISIGSNNHPSLFARKASTLSIPDAHAAGYLTGASADDAVRRTFQQGFRSLGAPSGSGYEQRLRLVKSQTAAFADEIGSFTSEGDGGYPTSSLGQGLRLASQLFQAEIGVRIVHVPMGEDFDTHDDHAGRHPALLESLDNSLEALMAELATKGLADRVLVVTTSEFGRAAHDNASSGLDHGTASMAMMLGPVHAGLYGEYPSLTKLDDNDDLVATVGFDQYYATIAEGWFGVPAADVLTAAARPIEGVLG